ncbi:MAG: Chromate transport protein [Planctomycetota bacterium]
MTGDWRTWLMIGAVGFGGPAGQVAILHRELVERRHWLDEEEFLAALRVCMLLPGPEAQQLATYAGWRRGGLAGGLLAGTLFVLPGAVLVMALAWLHAAGGSWPLVAAAFAGTRPAVVALVALAAWRIGRKSLTSAAAVAILCAAVIALVAGVAFPVVVLAAGVLGGLLLAPMVKTGSGAVQVESRTSKTRSHMLLELAPTPSPPRLDALRRTSLTGGRFARGVWHLALVAGVAAVTWAACLWGVAVTHAAGGRGAAIARLFTTTTLLSLGGAYAVVPWALDESVGRGWLAADERFTALAMGEATPGPLILVVTFIGFMAGWKAVPDAALHAGLAGGSIATVFAFLPSFALIFGLAPFVRSIHPGSWLGRAMTGVGGAVVAAILMLTLRLAHDAFLPAGQPDVLAIAVAVAGGAALVSGRASTPVVVLAAAAIGVVASLW